MIGLWVLSENENDTEYFYVSSSSVGTFKLSALEKFRVPRIHESGNVPNPKKVVPFNYMRYIEAEKNSNRLKVAYSKDSDFEYEFATTEKRNSVIDFIGHDERIIKRFEGRMSLFGLLKKPLLAMVAFTILLGWGYYTAWELEHGVSYSEHFILILLVAGIGTAYLNIIIPVVFAIIFLRIAYLLRNRDVITRFFYKNGVSNKLKEENKLVINK